MREGLLFTLEHSHIQVQGPLFSKEMSFGLRPANNLLMYHSQDGTLSNSAHSQEQRCEAVMGVAFLLWLTACTGGLCLRAAGLGDRGHHWGTAAAD